MRSLIWKELRENALWALSAAGLLLAGIAYLLSAQARFGIGRVYESPDLVFDTYKQWMLLGAPLAALALGIGQTIRERRPDAWAFLMHRPLTVSAIYVAKAIAGLGLYLAATLGALAVVTGWFLMPGRDHFPGPFDLRMSMPGLASIAVGSAFYFAAQLAMVRPARVWGSRLLPVVAAMAGLFGFGVAASNAPALIDAALPPLVLGWAAYGSYVSRGEYAPQTRAQRAALGATLLGGAAALVVTAGAAIAGLPWVAGWQQARQAAAERAMHRQPDQYDEWRGVKGDYAVTGGGKLVALREAENLTVTAATTLAGRPIPGASHEADDYLSLTESDSTVEAWPDTPGSSSGSSLQWNYYQYYVQLGGTERAFPYYDPRRHVVVVFDPSRGAVAGYLGPSLTLKPTLREAGRFAGGRLDLAQRASSLAGGDLLPFSDAVYEFPQVSSSEIDFRSLRKKLQAPAGAPFQCLAYLGSDSPRRTSAPDTSALPASVYDGTVSRSAFAAIAGGRLLLYDAGSGRQVFGAACAVDPARVQSVYLTLADNPLRLYALYDLGGGGYVLQTENLAGKTGQSMRLPRLGAAAQPQPSRLTAEWPMLVAPPVVVGAVAAFGEIASTYFNPGGRPLFADAWERRNFANAALWSCLGGALSAAALLVFLRRRYGWSAGGAAAWSAGVFLLSWAGLLLIAAMIPLPQRVRCPNCGRRRGVARAACEWCRVESLAPEADGREIFEGPAACAWAMDEERAAAGAR